MCIGLLNLTLKDFIEFLALKRLLAEANLLQKKDKRRS